MNYKKIINDKCTLHVIDTTRFKLNDIEIIFTKKFDKENIKYYNMLFRNICYSTKKYNTKEKIASKCEELYGLDVSSSYALFGDLESFSLHASFLDPKYVNEEYMKEVFDFFLEVLLNPNIENNSFNSEYYNRIKLDLIDIINSEKDNPSSYASKQFNKIMFKGTTRGISKLPTIEELDTIDEKKLYEFYKQLFDGEYKIDIIYYGNVNEEDINYIIDKIKMKNNNKITIKYNIKREDKLVNKVESLPFKQSKLYIGYDASLLNDYELKYVLKVYNTILGTMNGSILFNNVREKNNLCYSVSSYADYKLKALVVYSGINKENYDKAIKTIKECIDMMKDEKTISKNIKNAKKTINTFLNGYYDDPSGQMYNKYYNEFYEVEDVETMREKYNNVTIEDIINISNKIKLNVIYFLKGDK